MTGSRSIGTCSDVERLRGRSTRSLAARKTIFEASRARTLSRTMNRYMHMLTLDAGPQFRTA